MAILVHLSSEKNAASIKRSGLKLNKYRRQVFFMPLSSGYTIAYQWGREIQRFGIKNLVAIQFKIDTSSKVWHGKYNEEHTESSLKEALTKYRAIEDKLGYEFYITRNISKNEIYKIKNINKPTGWRYYPEAHGKKPCFCPACVVPGGSNTSKGRALWREKNEKPRYSIEEAKRIVLKSCNPDDLYDALWVLKSRKPRMDPSYLFRVLEYVDEFGEWTALEVIGSHRHRVAKEFILSYQSEDPDVIETINEIKVERGW